MPSSRLNTVQFHAGRLIVKGSDGYSVPAAELTDCSMSTDIQSKDLPNESLVSTMAIRTGIKVTIKAKIQRVLSSALEAAMVGGAVAATAKIVIDKEPQTAGASVTVTNGATFSEDLGVLDASGNPMTPISAAPAIGQYIPGVAGVGTYTFNIGETGTVKISYVKTSTTGDMITVDNAAQAESLYLTGWFWSSSAQLDGSTKKKARYFYKLVPEKLSEAQKRGEFADSDIELRAVATAANKFYEIHNS